MILKSILNKSKTESPQPEKPTRVGYSGRTRVKSTSGPLVTTDTAKTIATAYRAANLITDGAAKMPLQMFEEEKEGQIKRIAPDPALRNKPYLIEINPNLWGWTPFLFKKAFYQWLLFYGNSYIWSPPVWPFQMFILPADSTWPVYDLEGRIWYASILNSSGQIDYLPGPEVMHLLINPDDTGHLGRGVIQFAADTIGRQLSAHNTESEMYKNGLLPAAMMSVNATLSSEGRDEYRKEYGKLMQGRYDGVRLGILDNRILDFKPITMSAADAQFLQQIDATDKDIANFFGVPLHMLNMGKEAFNSNEQKYLEYLNETIDPYLVQTEQGARIKWIPERHQATQYFKFNRDATMRMTAKDRAEVNEIRIRSATLTPNEARAKDDRAAYSGGDNYYITKNYGRIDEQNTKES